MGLHRYLGALAVALLLAIAQPVSAQALTPDAPTAGATAEAPGLCEIFPFLPGC